ncbi:MAG TPA: uroporphyrinogen-III synthase, partial [Rhizobiales bacterium]|nr:uroporphyrinogen-III synthase [Hyphomicrobiales bacterium]
MHLLVTRPEPDAAGLIAGLELAGHKVRHFPLLEIRFHQSAEMPEIKPQAVLITSANGARGMERLADMQAFSDILAITVGASSAAAAEQAGFTNICKTGRGDVVGMIDYVRTHLKPENGTLLYASGHKTSGDLAGQLRESGFVVERVVLYQAVRAEKLPDELCQLIRDGGIDGVLLFSPRTAKIWLSVALSKSGGCVSG